MTEIEELEKMMEEMANAPKEQYGERQPGERGMYELHSSQKASQKPREGH